MFQAQSRAEGLIFHSRPRSFRLCTPSGLHLTKGVLITLLASASCQGMSQLLSLCRSGSVRLLALMPWTYGANIVSNLLRTFSNGIGDHTGIMRFNFP